MVFSVAERNDGILGRRDWATAKDESILVQGEGPGL